jgi:ornithine cyclodeaminase/alanine dehydrogenase-like protein (mu-crystallin family)
MRFLSESIVESLLPIDVAIEAAEEAFRSHSLGIATIPLRSEIYRENPKGTVLVMPGLVDNAILGVKLVASVAYGSSEAKSTTCMILIWDAKTLQPRGLISADGLNEHRTAAGLAAATRALARPESEVYALFGAGKLSFCAVRYIARVLPLRKLFIVSRTQSRVGMLADRIRSCPGLAGLDVCTSATPEQAAAEADVITTVTTSEEPVFDGRYVKPGTHINLGGAFRAHQREIDDFVSARARFSRRLPPQVRRYSAAFEERRHFRSQYRRRARRASAL